MRILKVFQQSTQEPYYDENGNLVIPEPVTVELTFEIENENFQKASGGEYIKIEDTGEIIHDYSILFVENPALFNYLEVGNTIYVDGKKYKIIRKNYDQEDHKEVILLAVQ